MATLPRWEILQPGMPWPAKAEDLPTRQGCCFVGEARLGHAQGTSQTNRLNRCSMPGGEAETGLAPLEGGSCLLYTSPSPRD
eukprot:1167869-Alexandrium_andersonii.AAC.1